MPLRKWSTFAVLLVALTGTAACATSSAVSSGESLNVQLRVDNNLPNIVGLTVYLMSDNGTRRSLGPVESNREAAYDRTLRAGTYQLIATRVGQPDIESERFRLDTDNLVVIWAVAQNQLTFIER